MIGDIIIGEGGTEYEVIWAGGEGLIPERTTKVIGFWTPPKRIYNKKNLEYWMNKGKKAPKLIDIVNEESDSGQSEGDSDGE